MSRHHQALNGWTRAKVNRQRLTIAALNGEPCHFCRQPINYALDGRTKWGPTVEHLDKLASGTCLDPYDMSRLVPAHRHCNCSDGATYGNQQRRPRCSSLAW